MASKGCSFRWEKSLVFVNSAPSVGYYGYLRSERILSSTDFSVANASCKKKITKFVIFGS